MHPYLTRALVTGTALAASAAMVVTMNPATGSAAPSGQAAQSPQAAQAAQPKRNLSVSSRKVAVGATYTVRGKVPSRRARQIQLWVNNGSRWTRISTTRTNRRGAFLFAPHAPNRPGTIRVRAIAPKVPGRGPRYKKFTTRTLMVKVVLSTARPKPKKKPTTTPRPTVRPSPTRTVTVTAKPTVTPTKK